MTALVCHFRRSAGAFVPFVRRFAGVCVSSVRRPAGAEAVPYIAGQTKRTVTAGQSAAASVENYVVE